MEIDHTNPKEAAKKGNDPTLAAETHNQFGSDAKTAWAAVANKGAIGGVSTPKNTLNDTPEKQRKKDYADAFQTLSIGAITAQIDRDLGIYIDRKFGAQMDALEKNWDNTPETERNSQIETMLIDGAKQRKTSFENAGKSIQSETNNKLVVATVMADTAEERGNYKLAGKIKERIKELTTRQKSEMTLSEERIRYQKLSPHDKDQASPDISKLYPDKIIRLAIEAEQKKRAGEGELSPREKSDIAQEIMLPTQLEESRTLLQEMQKAYQDLEENIRQAEQHGSGSEMALYPELKELEDAINVQKGKISLEENQLIAINMKGDNPEKLTAAANAALEMSEFYPNMEKGLKETGEQLGLKPEEIALSVQSYQDEITAAQISLETIKTMEQYPNRHKFIQTSIGIEGDSFFGKAWNSAENLVEQLWDGKETDAEKLMEMHEAPLQDSAGHLVHYSDKLGLYRVEFGDIAGIHRIPYTDPLEIAKLRAQAWDPENPKLYANEAQGKSLDPENNIITTFSEALSTKQRIVRAKMDTGLKGIKKLFVRAHDETAPTGTTPDFNGGSNNDVTHSAHLKKAIEGKEETPAPADKLALQASELNSGRATM